MAREKKIDKEKLEENEWIVVWFLAKHFPLFGTAANFVSFCSIQVIKKDLKYNYSCLQNLAMEK